MFAYPKHEVVLRGRNNASFLRAFRTLLVIVILCSPVSMLHAGIYIASIRVVLTICHITVYWCVVDLFYL